MTFASVSRRLSVAILVATFGSISPQQADAATYAYDGFDYAASTANNVTLVGKDPSLESPGSTGIAGAIVGAVATGQGGLSNVFQTTGLTFGTLQTRGGGARFKNSTGQPSYLAFNYSGSAPAAGSTLYTSYLIQSLTAHNLNSVAGLRMNTSKTSSSGTAFFFSGIDTSIGTACGAQYGTGSPNTTGGTVATINTTFLVVARYTNVGMTTGTRTARTYVLNQAQFANYADGGFGEAEWDAATIGSAADQVFGRTTDTYTGSSAFNLPTNGGIQFAIGNSAANTDVLYDELRCGSTVADVLPVGTPPTPALVSLSVTDAVATEPTVDTPLIGRFTLTRLDASTHEVNVSFAFTGTASNGTDYSLPTYATIPANTNSVVVEVRPMSDRVVEADETLTVTAIPGSGYTLDAQNSATITIQDGPFPRTRFIANLAAGIPQKIIVYGTSLTAGNIWPPQMKSALDAAYPGLTTLVNSGGSGENSVWGVANLATKVTSLAPDVVFIEFAVNDAVTRSDYANRITPSQARANLNSMINSIQAARPNCEIILQVMNPVIGASATSRPNLALCQQIYRDVAKERGFLVIDHMSAWQALLDQGTADFYTHVPDGLHPIASGYSLYVTPVILREIGATNNVTSGSVMLHANNQRPAEPATNTGAPRTVKITVTRGGPLTDALTVPLTIGGSAAIGVDFGNTPGSVTIPAGSSTASFEIIPTADNAAEGAETLTVGITPNAGVTLAMPNKVSLFLDDRPIDGWRNLHFTAGEQLDPLISGDTADADHDGINNLLEFYTNRSPKSANHEAVAAIGADTVGADNFLTLTYDRIIGSALTAYPQVSPDLAETHWANGPAHIEETILADTGMVQTVKARSRHPLGTYPQEFMRLKVARDSATAPATVVPAMPLGLAMTGNSADSITLTWYHAANNDAQAWNVYTSTATGGPYTLLTTVFDREATHTNLPASTTRYYKVSATNDAGESALTSAATGFTITPAAPTNLPFLVAKNMCVSLGQPIVSTVAPSSGTLANLVDGSDATSCTIAAACTVKVKINPAVQIADAGYLMLNFRSDTTGQSYAYNINYRALKTYSILESLDSTNGTDGTWTEIATGTNPYLDGVVVIPNHQPKWIAVQNSGSLQLCRLDVFRAAPTGYRNDYWIFAGDSLVVQDLQGGSQAGHTVWFSDLVRQQNPDRYPMVVNSSLGGEVRANTLARMNNILPVIASANGTNIPTGTFLCWEPGFNDVGTGGGFWQGPGIIQSLTDTQTLCNNFGIVVVPVRIQYTTSYLDLATLEPASSNVFVNTLSNNLAGVDVYCRASAPYACDPVTQVPYADYWTYVRNNYATALTSDRVHHTKAGCDGINYLWADVAKRMVYSKQP